MLPYFGRAGFLSQGKSSVSSAFVSSSRSSCWMRLLESSKLSQTRMCASSGPAARLRMGKKKVIVFDLPPSVNQRKTR